MAETFFLHDRERCATCHRSEEAVTSEKYYCVTETYEIRPYQETLTRISRKEVSPDHWCEEYLPKSSFAHSRAMLQKLSKEGRIPIWALFSALYLGLRGRVTRTTWWIKGIFPTFTIWVGILIIMLQKINSDNSDDLFGVLTIIMFIDLWAILAVTVKRLHDRNKSGLRLLLPIIPILAGFYWEIIWVLGGGIVLGLWIFSECGFMPSVTPNKYGNSTY